jgi:hypothetical protein
MPTPALPLLPLKSQMTTNAITPASSPLARPTRLSLFPEHRHDEGSNNHTPTVRTPLRPSLPSDDAMRALPHGIHPLVRLPPTRIRTIRSRKRSLASQLSFHMKFTTTTTNPDPDPHDERMESQRGTEHTDKLRLPRAVLEKVTETAADFYSGEKIADGHVG